jgi:hypothetical protein
MNGKVPITAHLDAALRPQASEIRANDACEEEALMPLPDPDGYTPRSARCDGATLARDRVHGRGRRLRGELASLVAVTPDGLHAQAAVVASDAGIDTARRDVMDRTDFEVCDAVGMSILRDLILMKPEPSRSW